MSAIPEKLRPFTFHGLTFAAHNGQVVGDCPLCGKKKHFYANPKSGLWDCKVCGDSGNVYDFIRLLHQSALDATTRKDWKELSDLRKGIPYEAFKSVEVARDGRDWLLPIRNAKGNVCNLAVWSGPGSKFLNTEGLPLYLYGEEFFANDDGDKERVFCIAEGYWDWVTLRWFLANAGPDFSKYVALGVPGASILKEDWIKLLKGRRVILLYDNDNAGLKGMDSAERKLAKTASALGRIQWNENLDDGYDISDFLSQKVDDPKSALIELFGLLVPSKSSDSTQRPTESKPRIFKSHPSWLQVAKEFRLALHISPSTEETLAVMLGTVLSQSIPGDPLWLFVVGPPSCLSGDTIIELNRAGKSFKIRLDNAVRMFHGYRRGGKVWDDSIPTYIRSRDNEGSIRLFPLKDAISMGKKQTYLLTTRDGHSIYATADHLFLTSQGWKRLDKLKIGDSVCVEKKIEKLVTKFKKTHSKSSEGLRHHPIAARSNDSRRRQLYHRLVVEASMNDLEISEYLKCLRNGKGVQSFKFLKKTDIVHHIDGNHLNNDLTNLEVIPSRQEHSRRHGVGGAWRSVTSSTTYSLITSIELGRVEETYDLTVGIPDGEGNFLANGIIVHNCGKTTFLQTFLNTPKCFFQSSLSSRLISGLRTSDDPKDDPSLLPLINHKVLVLKDYTEVMQMPEAAQEELYSVLRGAYDGRAEKAFLNGVIRVYDDCHFSILAGVTDAIHGHTRATLGERFLKINYLGNVRPDQSSQIFHALRNSQTIHNKIERLKQVVYEYLDTKIDLKKLPIVPHKYNVRLVGLSQVIAHLRAGVERLHGGDLAYRPSVEIGTRLAKQLKKLLISLCLVYGKRIVDDRIYAIVERVALDTAEGWNLDVATSLIRNYPKPLTMHDLEIDCRMSNNNMRKRLDNMLELDIVNRVRLKQESRGQPPYGYVMSSKVYALWKKAQIDIRRRQVQKSR